MRTLYHVTPQWNTASIREIGVAPLFSQGRRAWTYWVDENRLIWALAHVSSKRGIPVSQLVVVVANHPEDELIRTCFTGVYARDVVIKVGDIRPVNYMFPTEE